jgi:Transposase IS116/IS110/IS902 family
LLDGFGQHADAEIYRSQPGLGLILGARVLAEFGDDPDRYADAKARKNYSGMSPITKASGTKRVVLARYARNRRLGDALFLQAFAALHNSPGDRTFYDRQPAGAPPTTKPYAPSPIGSSASSTAAYETTPSTRNTLPGTTNQTNSAPQLDSSGCKISGQGQVKARNQQVCPSQGDGVAVTVFAFDIAGDRIKHIWAVRNPEKRRPRMMS